MVAYSNYIITAYIRTKQKEKEKKIINKRKKNYKSRINYFTK